MKWDYGHSHAARPGRDSSSYQPRPAATAQEFSIKNINSTRCLGRSKSKKENNSLTHIVSGTLLISNQIVNTMEVKENNGLESRRGGSSVLN